MWHTKIEAWLLNEAGIQVKADDDAGKLRAVS
jgi:hypothetical protein